jgi:AcrR family transcriptional regulator
MPADEVGLRERKKAFQRIAIVDVLLKALETNELVDLKIEDLCEQIGISKVTFFNYFSSKEQVLEHFVLTWKFKVTALLDEAGLTGLPAVHLIFDSVAKHPAAQHVMNAIVLFFLKSKTPRTIEIPDHEYSLLDPDAWSRGVRPAGIDELFARAIGGPPDDPETAALVRHR